LVNGTLDVCAKRPQRLCQLRTCAPTACSTGVLAASPLFQPGRLATGAARTQVYQSIHRNIIIVNTSAAPLLSFVLGASVSIAFAAVSGTAGFNAMAWLMAGPGITFAQAYSLAPHNAFYLVVFCGIPVAAGLLGGFVAAKLSHGNPYLSALVSALLVMATSVVFMASPVSEVTFNAVTLLPAFVFPVPCALLGAYLFSRRN
jgi:hypothetical protein